MACVLVQLFSCGTQRYFVPNTDKGGLPHAVMFIRTLSAPALSFHPILYPLFFSEFPWEEQKLTSYLVTDRLGLLVREK